MKYFWLLTLCLITSLTATVYAQTTHRITNGTNLQEFITTEANNGDILILEGGNYSSITIDKKLTIIGTGYFLDETNSATPRVSKINGGINFVAGSENSKVTGVELSSGISFSANSIEVTRCKFANALLGASAVANNTVLKNNFLTSGITIVSGCTTFLIKNNIIRGSMNILSAEVGYVEYNTFTHSSFFVTPQESVSFKNNLFPFIGSTFGQTSLLRSHLPAIATYNLFGNSTTLPLGDFVTARNNQVDVDFSNMFVGYPTNNANLKDDEAFKLQSAAPAKGACENGTDCGAFGGADPYVLNGIPNTPTITEMNVQPQIEAGDTLQVNIKARANN